MSAAPHDPAMVTSTSTSTEADHRPCPAHDEPSPEKHRANVMARAALAGVAVIELADGTYLAMWQGWLKPCPDLGAVQHLVRQLGSA